MSADDQKRLIEEALSEVDFSAFAPPIQGEPSGHTLPGGASRN